jgi:dGTP triphosphohydrolase
MDIADDIAYSTYDIEDAFKAEFLCPLGILSPKICKLGFDNEKMATAFFNFAVETNSH